MANQSPIPSMPQDVDAAVIFMEGLVEQAADFLPNAIGALVFLLIGLWVAGYVRGILRRYFAKSDRFDPLLEGFLATTVYYALILLVVVTTLGMFGVQTTSLAAMIGAAGLAVGLALQGTLSHVASGVMLLIFRPFSLGHYVETGGFAGTVKSITLFTTELATLDNRKVIIPNGQVWDSAIINYSANDQRRIDLVFGIGYGADINAAVSALRDLIAADGRILTDPEPSIGVDNLGNSSVDIACRVWVNTKDFLGVKWDFTKAVKERFDRDGIEIPFPTRTIVQRSE